MSKLYVKYWPLFCLIFGLGSFELKSQNIDLVLNVADQLFEKKDYYAAVAIYKNALQIDSNNIEVLYKYGKSLTAINHNKLASIYLKKALAYDSKKEIEELPFELAEAYRSSGNYKQAKRYYNRALRPYRIDKNGYWYKRINMSKKSNEWAYRKVNQKFTQFNNLGELVNSDFSEYGATIQDKQLFFSAMIADSVALGNTITDKHFYSRIYQKALNDNKPAKEVEFDRKALSIIQNKHLSNPSFFQDNIYFSICDTSLNCEIWKGDFINSKVLNLKKLNKNINNTTSNNTQAQVVQEDEDVVIYFVSDRNQGFGGLDIWKSKLESFGFGKAINLGNEINTPDNEITPFFDTKGRSLYFSSNWHIGFGGYDVFNSKLERKVFQAAENLGTQINSNFNEYYFQPYKDLAILSSNRTDGNVENSSACCNDLYETNFIREKVEIEIEKDDVDEEALNKFLPLSLYFHNDSPDPNSKDTTTSANFIDLANDYLNLKASYIQSYIPTLQDSKKEEAEIELNNFFEIELDNGIIELERITPLLLQELEKGHYLTLSVRGFASSLSNSDYNLKLTLRRIESLINYFKSQEGGKFNSFIKSRQLAFNKIPFGEFAVSSKIDEEDKIAAVYSLAAAKERKIEIIALRSSNPNTNLNIEKQAQLEISKRVFNVITNKGDLIKRGFLLENKGNGELKIYQIISNFEGVNITYPKKIAPLSSDRIIVEANTEAFDKITSLELLIVSNDSKRNLDKVRIEIKLID